MILRHSGQSMRFILGAMSVGAIVACTQDPWLEPVQPVPTRDVCDEAAEYSRRAAAAHTEQVRTALQRIADTKSGKCAAKPRSEGALDLR
jgi:hypothetical protein